MLDLEESLRQWRQKIEATLAFSSEEIDELEDHLRFSMDAKLKEGFPPEVAWTHSLGGLGSASALALEFAKDKLMPALWRLLTSWWQAALLLLLFGGSMAMLTMDNSWHDRVFWVMAWLSFAVMLILLPAKSQKNAVLAGAGNAFCLLPLLYVFVYNSATNKVVGWGWSGMGASFSWPSILLSAAGLFLINIWWWKRGRSSRDEVPSMLALASVIVFLLAIAPFCGELIGNLSLRELYSMPTAHDVSLMGNAGEQFMQWKFVAVLIDSLVLIANSLPFVLVAVVSLGILAHQGAVRDVKAKTFVKEKVFPAASDLPWIMTLLTSGACWLISISVELPFTQQLRNANESIHHGTGSSGGLVTMLVFSAILFLICVYEMTRRLRQAERIRLFYSAMLAAAQLGVLFGAMLVPVLVIRDARLAKVPSDLVSTEPPWLSWIFILAVAFLIFQQTRIIEKKYRDRACELSIWRYEAKNLVPFGLLLGVILACSGLMLWLIALDMAFASTSMIGALIDWGNSIEKPATIHFYPQNSVHGNHSQFWTLCSLGYLFLCLTVGLLVTMLLSALEFIRFNSFRLYKIRKARNGLLETLALNK